MQDVQASVVAMAALQLASGASDEEWSQVMLLLGRKDVPMTSGAVVTQVRSALDAVRSVHEDRV